MPLAVADEKARVAVTVPNGPKGVFAAALTPVTDDLAPDTARLVEHCRWLLANGCDGVAPLGTTGEASSFSLTERMAIMDALAESGIPGERFIIGTGSCAITEAVELTRRAVAMGAAGALVIPPFYFKSPSEDGLFAFYSELIQRIGDSRLRIYLYHFPQTSAVPIGLSLIERLLARYPQVVAGAKDSAGEIGNMIAMARIPQFRVFSGTERLLLPVLEAGGAGCITAGANVIAPITGALYAEWRRSGASAAAKRLQDEVTRQRLLLDGYPMIPAMKALLARRFDAPQWRNVRPPFVRLPSAHEAALFGKIDGAGLVLP
ncbi:MAG: dihydrodipicolinate synthase family protein [Gemmatimonas sp.]